MKFPGRLYAIIDPCGQPIDPVALAAELLDGGARVLQLRWKEASAVDLVRAGREIQRLVKACGGRLIINDRIDVALAAGADGAHLGQDDLPADLARSLLDGRILGVSTHDVEQARAAERRGADYIGFGPMFVTGTKATGVPPRGITSLREVHRAVTIPIVAIGGIRTDTAASCLAAGADAVAMISELVLTADRAAAVRRVLQVTAPVSPGE